ncbi:hypothetical protein [Yersinia intermedia]|uniref:hypothetical protein n=1 Tax=Yersinia intermedia TaxID=631 RepID=UPI0022FEE29D|nr:hypothetical protein [Yersinia intermedia]MDA5510524.1 hypothetical protein [Yersinia intermedia]
MLSKKELESRANQIREYVEGNDWLVEEQIKAALENADALEEVISLREQLAELKASIGFNVGDRVCDSVDKLGYGYVVSINNGRVAYPISVQFDKSDKGRISTYTADGRKLSGCPVCLYKTPSVTAAKPAGSDNG